MPLYGIVFIAMMLQGLVETTIYLYGGQDFYSFQNDLFPEKFLKEIAPAPFNVWNATAPLTALSLSLDPPMHKKCCNNLLLHLIDIASNF